MPRVGRPRRGTHDPGELFGDVELHDVEVQRGALDAGRGEQVGEQSRQPARAARHAVEQLGALVVPQLVPVGAQQLRRTSEHADRRAQLVRRHREEVGLVVGGLQQPGVGLLEPRAGLTGLGVVPGDLAEADQLTVAIPDRRDRHVRPEARPVLADPPPLFLVAALAQCDLELVLRMPLHLLLRRVEDPEVLADDLLGGPALAPLGPGVPADDVTLGVEHEDRVVLHRLDQQPQHLLGLALAADVLDLEEQVERPSGGVPDRRDHGPHPMLRGAVQGVLQPNQVISAIDHPAQRRPHPVGVRAGELGVRRAHQLGHPPTDEPGQAPVAPDHPPGERHGGHPDGRLLEDLLEALQVFVEHALLRVCGCLVGLRGRSLVGRRFSTQHREEIRAQALERGGLLHERRRPQGPAAIRQPVLGEAAVHHDPGARRDGSHPRQCLEAVHAGHGDVEEQQVRLESLGQIDRILARRPFANDVEQPRQREPGAHQRAHLHRIVDNDDRRDARHDGNLPPSVANARPFLRGRSRARRYPRTHATMRWQCSPPRRIAPTVEKQACRALRHAVSPTPGLM